MKKIKKALTWFIMAALLLAGGFLIFKSKNKQVGYALTPVERMDIKKTISADGKYLSKDEANVSFRISGPVTKLGFDVGDKVKKGQFLARVDTGVLFDKLQQAEKEVGIQKKTLDYYERKNDIFSKEQRQGQKDAVKKAQAVVDEVNTQLRYANVFSPMSGTVAEKDMNLGEIAGVGVPIVKIINESGMRIEANVPEVDIANVKEGQRASVKFDAFSDNERFQAAVTEIDPSPITVQNVVYYTVKLNVEDPDSKLKYGMSCTVYDEVYKKDGVIGIPKWAVEKEDKKSFVTIMKDVERNIVEKREVKTGSEGDAGMIEIISGLDAGDQIASMEQIL